MKMTIKHFIALSIIFVCSIASSESKASIEWLEPRDIGLSDIKDSCPEILEVFNYRYMSAVELDNSLTSDKIQLSMYQYDLNNDGLIDYLIQDKGSIVGGSCGSLGCATNVFLFQKDGMNCKKIPFVYFDAPYGKLGVGDNHSIFILSSSGVRKGGGRCTTLVEWKLVDDKFKFVRSLECLPKI